jgi:hypothetical protein
MVLILFCWRERFSALQRPLRLNEQVLKLRGCFLDYGLVVVVLFFKSSEFEFET